MLSFPSMYFSQVSIRPQRCSRSEISDLELRYATCMQTAHGRRGRQAGRQAAWRSGGRSMRRRRMRMPPSIKGVTLSPKRRRFVLPPPLSSSSSSLCFSLLSSQVRRRRRRFKSAPLSDTVKNCNDCQKPRKGHRLRRVCSSAIFSPCTLRLCSSPLCTHLCSTPDSSF